MLLLDADEVGATVALMLETPPVDEHTRVRLEPRAGQRDVGVEAQDLVQ